jgi:hypothetical protein
MEGLVMGYYLFVKMNSSKISEQHSRFLTIRTISNGKSLGRPPVSDERNGGKDSTDIHSLFISTIWCTTKHLSQNH